MAGLLGSHYQQRMAAQRSLASMADWSTPFEDACFRHFEATTAACWQRCVHAVALARKDFPGFLDDTYQQAANDVAYYYK